MTEIYFTSDLHLGHKLISELRHFPSVEAHDETVIRTLNNYVTKKDQLWILGDVFLGSQRYAFDLLRQLPCELHLVAGNHDPCHPLNKHSHREQRKYLEVFASVQSAARKRINGVEVLLSHFPYSGDHTGDGDRFTQWRLPNQGVRLLHGHTHQPHVITSDDEFHVGWDAHFAPVSWSRLSRWVSDGE